MRIKKIIGLRILGCALLPVLFLKIIILILALASGIAESSNFFHFLLPIQYFFC